MLSLKTRCKMWIKCKKGMLFKRQLNGYSRKLRSRITWSLKVFSHRTTQSQWAPNLTILGVKATVAMIWRLESKLKSTTMPTIRLKLRIKRKVVANLEQRAASSQQNQSQSNNGFSKIEEANCKGTESKLSLKFWTFRAFSHRLQNLPNETSNDSYYIYIYLKSLFTIC